MEEYCKHWAQNMFTILSLLSTNLGKEQLFGKVVTTKVSLSSLQAILKNPWQPKSFDTI
jgi:hypothetical protein